MANPVDLEFRAGGSLFKDLQVMQAEVNGLGDAHKKVHAGIQEDLSQSSEGARKFGANVSAASQLVVALAKSSGQGLQSLARNLQEVADLTEQAQSGLAATDKTNLTNVNAALRSIAQTQGIVVRSITAEKRARIEALVEAKKVTAEEGKLLVEVTEVVDTMREAIHATSELPAAIDDSVESTKTLAQQYREAVREAQRIGQEFGKNSDEFLDATRAAALLRKEISDVGDRIKALNPGDKLAAFSQFGNAIASGAQAVGGFFVTFSNGNQAIQETIYKFQSFLFAIQGAQGFIRDFKDAFENVRAVLGLTAEASEAAALASEADAISKGEEAVATEAVGVASTGAAGGVRAFTAALLANPLTAAVAILLALAGAMFLFANNTEQAVETYDDLLERLQRPVKRRQLEGELDQAELLAKLEAERLKRIEDFQAGRRSSIERTSAELAKDAERQRLVDQKLRGSALDSIDVQRVAFQSLQETKRRAIKENERTGEKEVADAAAFATLRLKLGLDESAKLVDVEKAYYDKKAQFREAELQGQAELAAKREQDAAKAADKLQEQLDKEKAAAELRLRIREQLAANIEAIEKDLAEKIKALELDKADPMEQVRLRKAASDEEIRVLERNLRREIALGELRAKVGDEAFDKLTERQKQARADAIIDDGGGQLSTKQDEALASARLLVWMAHYEDRAALQAEFDQTLADASGDSDVKQLAELDKLLAERAKKLKDAGATEAEIEADAQIQTAAVQKRLGGDRIAVETQTQVDILEAQLNGGNLSVAQEKALQIELLKVKIKGANAALALIVSDGSDRANAEIAAAKNVISKLKKELGDMKSQIKPFKLSDLFNLEGADADVFNKAAGDFITAAFDIAKQANAAQQQQLDQQISATDALIEDYRRRGDELQAQLAKDEEANKLGLANNLNGTLAAIAANKAAEEKALAEKKRIQAEKQKLARQQVVLDSISQASALATSAAQTIQGLSGLPFGIGLLTAFALIAQTYSFFAGFKAKIAAASQPQGLYRGTKSVQLNGSPKGRDTIPAMLDEGEAVISARNNRKYKHIVGAIVDDDFSKLPPHVLRPLLDSIDLSDMLRGTGVKVSEKAVREDIQTQERSAAAPAMDVRGLEARIDRLTEEVVSLRKDAKNRTQTETLPNGTRITRRPGETIITRP